MITDILLGHTQVCQLKQIFSSISIQPSFFFKSTKLSSYFSLKDPTPLPLRSGVVYQYTCSCDGSPSYIGKTIRHLSVRAKEHFSSRTPSAISDHLSICNQSFHINKFSILATGLNDFDLKVKEALLIKHHQPSLNNQIHHSGASFLLKIF